MMLPANRWTGTINHLQPRTKMKMATHHRRDLLIHPTEKVILQPMNIIPIILTTRRLMEKAIHLRITHHNLDRTEVHHRDHLVIPPLHHQGLGHQKGTTSTRRHHHHRLDPDHRKEHRLIEVSERPERPHLLTLQ